MITQEDLKAAKQSAAKAASKLVQSGMLVGLGTGSTAFYCIENLIERCKTEGLRIWGFPTSQRSAKQAIAGGIPLCDESVLTRLDITIDGADEIDHQKRLIKGGGGALLREKMIASLSSEMIVIADESKLVNALGGFPLPVEIVPFAHHATLFKVRELGYDGALRLSQGEPYVTDNGNYIIDIVFPGRCSHPEKEDALLSAIPGVVETGFFFGLAGRVVIGQFDHTVRIF